MIKLLIGMQRPHPRGAKDIGYCKSPFLFVLFSNFFFKKQKGYDVLDIIGYIAIITNLGLVIFTSNSLDNLLPTMEMKLWTFLIAEHIVFILKWVIARLIPDTPGWVRREYAKRAFFRELRLQGNLSLAKSGDFNRTSSSRNIGKDPMSFLS